MATSPKQAAICSGVDDSFWGAETGNAVFKKNVLADLHWENQLVYQTLTSPAVATLIHTRMPWILAKDKSKFEFFYYFIGSLEKISGPQHTICILLWFCLSFLTFVVFLSYNYFSAFFIFASVSKSPCIIIILSLFWFSLLYFSQIFLTLWVTAYLISLTYPELILLIR